MVKHPQSILGYVVNGETWFPPRRRRSVRGQHPPPRAAAPGAAGPSGRTTVMDQMLTSSRKEQIKDKRRARTNRGSQRISYREVCRELRVTKELEDLKNASKQGDAQRAFNLAETITRRYFRNSRPNQMLLFMVRSLVVPDIEIRSAVYYAAHAGHAGLVKAYMAALVLVRYERNPRKVAAVAGRETVMSIQDWLNHLGYISFFGPKELDICVLNGSNDEVKAVFQHETYSLQGIRDTVSRSPWGRYVLLSKTQQQLNGKKKILPSPVMDDFASHVDGGSFSDNDFFDGDHYDDNARTEDVLLDSYQEEADELSDFADLQPLSDEDEIVMQLYGMIANETTAHRESEQEIEPEAAHLIFNQDDDWSEIDESVAGSSLQQNEQDDWSILSDVASVQSMINSSVAGPMSYVDALQTNGSAEKPGSFSYQDRSSKGSWRRRSQQVAAQEQQEIRTRIMMPTVLEETKMAAVLNQNDDYDDFFMQQCAKGCRGGRAEFHFKGNQKTPPITWSKNLKVRMVAKENALRKSAQAYY
jgi:hypothetical protein